MRPNPAPSALSGQHFLLAPVFPDDHAFLFWLSAAEEIAYRWRSRGALPSFESFRQHLDANVFAQFVVRRRSDGERVGHVVAYAADLRNGHVSVSNVHSPQLMDDDVSHEAYVLFVDYLFAGWSFNKIYVNVPEFIDLSLRQWLGDDILSREGLLTSHCFYRGEYWDQCISAIYREAWAPSRDAATARNSI